MALVAYDNSDSSEFEEDDCDSSAAGVISNKKEELSDTSVSQPVIQNEAESQNQSLFNLLPQPTNKKPTVFEEDDEFLHKKETAAPTVKPKAKITVPSLNDFRDVEGTSPAAKPKKVNGKNSGLLSILPQPRNAVVSTTKSLIPHVLTQKPKPNITTAKKKLTLQPMKKNKAETQVMDCSDDSDNEEVQNDFFSINKPAELPVEDVPLNVDEEVTLNTNLIRNVSDPSVQKRPRDIQSYFKADAVESEVQKDSTSSTSVGYDGYSEQAAEGTNNDAVLDEEAILKLCGTRGKRRREDIQIVEVDQQAVLADARAWLARGLAEDTGRRQPSARRGDGPTTQQKRKHQITYLAHQAKANEIELQNQWANNRMSKRQTQSKYGF